jgi:hypothetical protein
MNVPLIFSFWFMVAAYVIHVIDESLLGGSFVGLALFPRENRSAARNGPRESHQTSTSAA